MSGCGVKGYCTICQDDQIYCRYTAIVLLQICDRGMSSRDRTCCCQRVPSVMNVYQGYRVGGVL